MQNLVSIHDRMSRIVEVFGDGKNTVIARLLNENEANIRGYCASVIPKQPFLEKIVRKFDISPQWLLTGEGAMLRSEESKAVAIASANNEGIPYFAIDFIAGFDEIFNSQVSIPSATVTFPMIKGAECWVDVAGKSMEPTISPGDIIAIRQVSDWRNNILYGEIYAIVTEEYRTIKRIRKSSVEGYITLVPENKDYDSQDILSDNVRSVYQVLGCAKKLF